LKNYDSRRVQIRIQIRSRGDLPIIVQDEFVITSPNVFYITGTKNDNSHTLKC